jgi:dimethylamine/trimethylamine dehydrogenase
VLLATGARWRRDGVGRANTLPIPGFHREYGVLTPDELMDGVSAAGPVVVFASAWTVNTLEQHTIQKRILNLGIELMLNRNVVKYDGHHVALECTYTKHRTMVSIDTIVTVTSRLPNEELALDFAQMSERLAAARIVSVSSIGDCLAPSTLAAAVYDGHRYAREFELPPDDRVPFRRELVGV